MQAHRVETIVLTDGTLVLENLPFETGKTVEVIIREKQAETAKSYPLRGTDYKYEEPFEPAAPFEDWETPK